MKAIRVLLGVVAPLLALTLWIGGCSAPAACGYSASGADVEAGGARNAVIPGQTTPSRDEELWVVSKFEGETSAAADNDTPGSGALMAQLPGEQKPVPVPLKHTDVKVDISGYIASVNVTQKYHNPFSSKIEAVYVFPLPHNAAVSEFVMTIGQRKIRGVIRERAEAERVYAAARGQGYVASLLTQERPNVFTQAVANIEPGKEIDVDVRYFHTLAYDDGWYEWHFPMVVGPRFNPPATTDGVGAAPRGAYGSTNQKTEVQYLEPTERSGHDIALSVNVEAGVILEEMASIHHTIVVGEGSGVAIPAGQSMVSAAGSFAGDPNKQRVAVRLAPNDSLPNKDFVLRYRVAGDKLKSAIVTSRDEKGGFFTLMLYPPQSLNHLPRKPLELVYVIDCSGSMSGQPIAQANAAVRAALARMGPDDTFQIIKFASDARLMTDRPVPATPENVRRGIAYLSQNYGGGGTMMMEGIKKALDFPPDQSRLRFVCFLTDGFIGNEAEILGEVHRRIGPSRIFSFGVGSSVNRYLLDHMARIGRGAVAYLALNQKAEPVMDAFFERIAHPALTDVSIDWGQMGVSEVYPARVPDLFVGRPVIMAGRFTGAGPATVRVKGRVGDETEEMTLAVKLDATGPANAALRPVWARAKIADLADASTWNGGAELPAQIKSLALEHGLMSPYTAFLAVDATRETEGAFGTSVAVPVPTPEGVKYDTTVGKK